MIITTITKSRVRRAVTEVNEVIGFRDRNKDHK